MKFISAYDSGLINLNDIMACMNPEWFSSKSDYILKFLIDCKAGNGFRVAFLTDSELEGLIDRLIRKLV